MKQNYKIELAVFVESLRCGRESWLGERRVLEWTMMEMFALLGKGIKDDDINFG